MFREHSPWASAGAVKTGVRLDTVQETGKTWAVVSSCLVKPLTVMTAAINTVKRMEVGSYNVCCNRYRNNRAEPI